MICEHCKGNFSCPQCTFIKPQWGTRSEDVFRRKTVIALMATKYCINEDETDQLLEYAYYTADQILQREYALHKKNKEDKS